MPKVKNQSRRQNQIHVVTRSHKGVGDIVGNKLGDKVGDKMGNIVEDNVGDKSEDRVGDKMRDMREAKWETKPEPGGVGNLVRNIVGDKVGDEDRSMSKQDLTKEWET